MKLLVLACLLFVACAYAASLKPHKDTVPGKHPILLKKREVKWEEYKEDGLDNIDIGRFGVGAGERTRRHIFEDQRDDEDWIGRHIDIGHSETFGGSRIVKRFAGKNTKYNTGHKRNIPV